MEGSIEMNFEDVVKGGILYKAQRKAFYDRMKSVVVNVEILNEDDKLYYCEGAGVFVSSEGHVLTLSQMLGYKSEAKVRIVTVDGREYTCQVINVDEGLGLTLLQVDNLDEDETYPYANIYDGKLEFAEKIYPIGHTFCFDYSFSNGRISHPCRNYGEVLDSLNEDPNPNRGFERIKDPSAQFVFHVFDLNEIRLKKSVPLVQVNNIHGDGLSSSRGMPFFNHSGHIIGMYIFMAHEQCFGIHARGIRSYINKHLDVAGSGQASTSAK